MTMHKSSVLDGLTLGQAQALVGGGSSLRLTVNQPGHGFGNGNAIRRVSGGYALALADELDNCDTTVAIVEEVTPGPPIDSYTELLLHCDGAANSTSFPDASPRNRTVTATGSAKVTQTYKKFGTGGLELLPQNSALELTADSDWVAGTGDATWDCWIRLDKDVAFQAYNYFFYHAHSSGGMYMYLQGGGNDGKLTVGYGGTEFTFDSGTAWPDETWFHVAMVKSGNAIMAFRNGVKMGSNQDCTGVNYSLNSGTIYIGRDPGGSWVLFGQMEEIRWSKTARWTANFTPPTAAYGDSEEFLANFGGPCDMPDAVLTDGTLYYLDATTPGARTAVPPSTAGQIQMPILVATGTTSGIVRIGNPIIVPVV